MRDPIRELDLATASGDPDATVTDGPNGIVSVAIKRDALDRLVEGENRAHWGCRTEDDCQEAFDRGVDAGRKSALDEVRALDTKASA